jgi:hypothetical protein
MARVDEIPELANLFSPTLSDAAGVTIAPVAGEEAARQIATDAAGEAESAPPYERGEGLVQEAPDTAGDTHPLGRPEREPAAIPSSSEEARAPSASLLNASQPSSVAKSGRVGVWVGGVLALIFLLVVIAAGMGEDRPANSSAAAPVANASITVEEPLNSVAAAPEAEPLLVGTGFEWPGEGSAEEVRRQAGPYLLRIGRDGVGAQARPILEISANEQTIRPDMSFYTPGSPLKISLIQNIQGAVPVLLMQAFTGGAHCCVVAKLIGLSSGRLTVVDLGEWDGDTIPIPVDLSGDGVADFVFHDERFLYAFASYASSIAPPRIYNATGGRIVEVSTRPEFRELFERSMTAAAQECVSGSSGDDRNGACPAYVAAAARLNRADEAWPRMLAAYDATTNWSLPTGCQIPALSGCPEGLQISYPNYPEALLHFLKDRGYLPPDWQPPQASVLPGGGDVPAPATPPSGLSTQFSQ